MEVILIIFVLILFVIIFVFLFNKGEKVKSTQGRSMNEIVIEMDQQFFSKGIMPTRKIPGLLLNTNEHALFQAPSIILGETRIVQSGGVVLPGAYGLGIYLGESQVIKDLSEQDNGRIILTNYRFIFTGKYNTFNIDIPQILKINFSDDMILINSTVYQQTIVFKTRLSPVFKKLFDLVIENKDDMFFNNKIECVVFPSVIKFRSDQNSKNPSHDFLPWFRQRVDLIRGESDPLKLFQIVLSTLETIKKNLSEETIAILEGKIAPVAAYVEHYWDHYFTEAFKKQDSTTLIDLNEIIKKHAH
jgi:hypothetical protein